MCMRSRTTDAQLASNHAAGGLTGNRHRRRPGRRAAKARAGSRARPSPLSQSHGTRVESNRCSLRLQLPPRRQPPRSHRRRSPTPVVAPYRDPVAQQVGQLERRMQQIEESSQRRERSMLRAIGAIQDRSATLAPTARRRAAATPAASQQPAAAARDACDRRTPPARSSRAATRERPPRRRRRQRSRSTFKTPTSAPSWRCSAARPASTSWPARASPARSPPTSTASMSKRRWPRS